MSNVRTACARIAPIGFCAVFVVADAAGQAYPSRPIYIVEGFTAGSASDGAAREVARRLTEPLGQPVVVDNRGGAGGILAAERVAKSAPDGYTLLLMAAAHSITPAIYAKIPYAMPGDFAPISLAASGPFLLIVHPSVPARNVGELIALARSRPGALNYASAGVGSSPHMAFELLTSRAKVSILHVPYKGSPAGVAATVSGEVAMAMLSITSAMALVNANKVRALGVSTAKRTALLPSMPTLDESGLPGYDRTGWYGLVAPIGVSSEILAKLNATVVRAMGTPEVKAALFKQGLEPRTSSAQDFGAFIQREIDQNIKLARDAGIKPQ
ncbi:MAG: tripartite tricarboxylate transporter substrate binding protein [Burkholderiales bacterium]|nr:tripartite tricarboxylate transporter substrate binding protein [Burkholderiales bacterium]